MLRIHTDSASVATFRYVLLACKVSSHVGILIETDHLALGSSAWLRQACIDASIECVRAIFVREKTDRRIGSAHRCKGPNLTIAVDISPGSQ
jgi:hypothetical protein